MIHALGFQPHPQLQLVRWHAAKIGGHVLHGECVQAGSAIGEVNFPELVFDENLSLRLDEGLELFLQFAVARGPVFRLQQVVNLSAADLAAHLGFLVAHFVADFFLRGENLQIVFCIGGADGRRALEHHVFKQMRHAGDAGALVGAADVRDPAAGDARLVVVLDEQEFHAIAKIGFDNRNWLRRGEWKTPQ